MLVVHEFSFFFWEIVVVINYSGLFFFLIYCDKYDIHLKDYLQKEYSL